MTQSAKTKKIFDGRYEIIEIVGRGACSVVYHARHATAPATDVALKVLLNKKGEPPNTDRLRKEALAMVSSRHRYVIRLDDFHSVGDLCYLSMEFAPGSDLRKYSVKKKNSLPMAQIERFLLQAAEALGFIHRAGIIHRDIKPDNILVMNDNEIRLGDFGVSVLPGEESTLDELQKGVGTMDYMGPEVLEGVRYDQRSDVYALAVTFYEIISGKHPFANAPLMQQLDVRNDGKFQSLHQAAPHAPKYLSDVIMKAMSYDREARYATGRDMLQAILVGKSEAETGKTKSAQAAPPAAPEMKPIPKAEPAVQQRTEDKGEKTTAPQSAAPHTAPKAPPPTQQKAPRIEKEKPTQEPKAAPSSPHQRMRPFQQRDKGAKTPPEKKNTESTQSVTPAVQLNDTPKKDTVSVPPAALGAALERQPKRTMVLSAELREATGLSADALMKAQNEGGISVRAETSTDIKAQVSKGTPEKRRMETPTLKKPQPISSDGSLVNKLKEAQGKAKEALATRASKLQKLPAPSESKPSPRSEETAQLAGFNLRFLGLLGLLAVGLLWFLLSAGSENAHQDEHPNATASTEAALLNGAHALNIPKVTEQNLEFPRLAPGLYTGKLEGLVPGQTTPLTIISLQGRNDLVFILGLQGWVPTLVPFSNKTIKENAEDLAPRLRVASSGIILEFTGQTIDGELLGYFSNLVNGDQGRWEAAPVR